VAFEDDRIHFARKEDGSFERGKWEDAGYKATFPFHQVPVLAVDGVQIAQSSAISRFLARRLGFFGSNDVETAVIDAIWEEIIDIRKGFFQAKEKDGATPGENLAKYFSVTFPEQVGLLEKNAKGSEGFFVGSKLSLADFGIYYLLWVFNTENSAVITGVLANNSKVKKIYDNVANNANVAAWVKERPQTIF